jgi:hypothetical protein
MLQSTTLKNFEECPTKFSLDIVKLKYYRFPNAGERGQAKEEKILEQPGSDERDYLCSEKSGKETGVTIEETPKKERKIFFETKTMAEVYAKQGHAMIALEIYKRIFQKNPSDAEAQKRISELETKLSSRREKLVRTHGDPSKEGNST